MISSTDSKHKSMNADAANETGKDTADGQVSIQLLQVATTPHVLQDDQPAPVYSCVNIAVPTGNEQQVDTSCLGERTKRILIRVCITIAILIALSAISAIEAALGRDIINTEELVKVIKGEVDSLVSNDATTKQV